MGAFGRSLSGFDRVLPTFDHVPPPTDRVWPGPAYACLGSTTFRQPPVTTSRLQVGTNLDTLTGSVLGSQMFLKFASELT